MIIFHLNNFFSPPSQQIPERIMQIDQLAYKKVFFQIAFNTGAHHAPHYILCHFTGFLYRKQ